MEALNNDSNLGLPNNTFTGLLANSVLSMNILSSSYFIKGVVLSLRPQICLLKLISKKALQNKKLGRVLRFFSSVIKILNSNFGIMHGEFIIWNR